jgi:hypothetical protein
MLERKRSGWVADLVRGLASGLAASWIMERAQAQLWKLGGASTKERERRAANDEPATVKTAEAIAERAGLRLDERQKARGGAIVHYATGAGWGAVYGLLRPRVRFPLLASGLAFGGLLWLVSDELLVPLLGFSKPPRAYPLSVHLKALAAHLIYGTATAAGARLLPGAAPG